MSKKPLLVLLSLLAALGIFAVGCASNGPGDGQKAPLAKEAAPITLPPGFIDEGVGGFWSQATGITFSSDGRTFVWEKAGRVWEVDEDGTRHTTPLLDISEEVGDWRDHGLLSVAFHPNFANNGYFYLLYVVDYHYLKYFGTPSYQPLGNQYLTDTMGRVTRFTARASDNFQTTDPNSRLVLLGDTMGSGCAMLNQSHGVGTVMFAEDGTLLISCGDGGSYDYADAGGQTQSNTAIADGIIRPAENVGAFRAQLPDALNGKVLRINAVNGDGIPSNPFYDPSAPRAARSRVWALGLRNPFRITVRPGSGGHDPAQGTPGAIYIGDVGWNAFEELNVAVGPAKNFGWPLYEGLNPHPQYTPVAPQNQDAPNPLFGTTPAGQSQCTKQYFSFSELLVQDSLNASSFPNSCDPSQQVPSSIRTFKHTRPVLEWGPSSGARVGTYNGSGIATVATLGTAGTPPGTPFTGSCSTGGTWYQGDDFPASYKNTYFHADYVGGWIKNLVFDEQNRLVAVRDFAPTGGAPVVSMATNPITGGLYYVAYDSTVRRIRNVGGGNRPPSAVAFADFGYGASPLTVHFTGNQSRDPELGPLSYSWNFGDGSPADNAANPVHVFNAGNALPRAYSVVLQVTDVGGLTATTGVTIVVNDTPPRVSLTQPTNGGVFSVTGPTTISLVAVPSDDEEASSSLTCSWQTSLHHNAHTHPEPPAAGCQQSAVVTPVACDEETYYFEFAATVSDSTGLSTQQVAILYPDCTPTILTPPDVSNKNPSYSWIRVLGADKFELAVDDSSGPGRIAMELSAGALGCGNGAPECTTAPLGALALGPASVRVRAHNPVDGWRAWSAPHTFTVGRCGDGALDAGEACDDGNAVDNDACSNTCVSATCTDGRRNQGETDVDCGGPCVVCDGCAANKLDPVAATASSEDGTGVAANAIDDSLTTRWSSTFSDPQWLMLDFGARRHIKRVFLHWEAAAASNYDIQVSDSASGPFTTVFNNPDGDGGDDDIKALSVKARYVRMYSRSRTTQWGNSLWEFEVFGDTNIACGLPVTCGNGTPDAGEQCDDGNNVDTDTCSNACVSATCTDGVKNQGETGTDCGGPCSVCVVCGDGVVGGNEQCDDGNTVNTDTCSNACVSATCADGVKNQGEIGIDCGSPCAACVVCGDGVVSGSEQCDDGNNVNTDACSNSCVRATCSDNLQNQSETGTDCGGPCTACNLLCSVNRLTTVAASASSEDSTGVRAALAIDGSTSTRWGSAYADPQWLMVDLGGLRRVKRVVLRWEAAAAKDYDIQVSDSASGPWSTIYTDPNGNGGVDDITGLSANGRYVRMYSRTRATQWGNSVWEFEVYGDLSPTCGTPPTCGNGALDSGEECDDGNTVDNDVCSNACVQARCTDALKNQGETGTDCGGPCAACVVCGDGIVTGGEQCDDGNTVNTDTCSNTCVSATCSDNLQNQGETGTDCGGPCTACNLQCTVNRLTTTGASASSESATSLRAALAIDGSTSTRWGSAYTDPQWLMVDLGALRRVKRVVLRWEAAAAKDYDIQVSDSASGPFTTIYTDPNGNAGVDDITGLSANGRYVRMYSRSRTTQWGNSLYELEVYGDLSPTCGQPQTCGNGTLDSGEQCDDGNTVNTDTCSNTCVSATCADGVQNQGETATDCGGPCAACLACGDGVVAGTEQCDDGNTVNNDTCSNTCIRATCSDNLQNQGETGTDCGGPCAACLVCGDGIVSGSEQCDDGNNVNTDTCSNTCIRASCSDNLQNQGETGTDCGGPCSACMLQCTVNRLATSAATASSEEGTLRAALAIDGSTSTRWSSSYADPQWLVVDLGALRRVKRVVLRWEGAAAKDYDLQVSDSASGPWSTVYTDPNGNGGVDDITGLSANGRYVRMYSRSRTTQWGNSLYELEVYGDLSPTCGTPPTCGNGTLNAGEECDDGNTIDNDVCSNTCVQARCTDGVRNQGETGTDCGGPCSACIVCGDGTVAGSEQCDDGNTVNTDTCSNACILATCSDNVQNQSESGTDCGGPCSACGQVCSVNRLTTTAATASSEEGTLRAALAIDGSTSTRWSSLYADPQWLMVDLGALRRVKRVILRWEGAAAKDYDIQVSDTASGPWTTIYADPNGNGGVDTISGLNTNGRYVRMYSRSRTTPWGNSLYEFEVYGDLGTTCQQ